jgi:hypothetical protein
MADQTNAEILQVLGGQARQKVCVDLVRTKVASYCSSPSFRSQSATSIAAPKGMGGLQCPTISPGALAPGSFRFAEDHQIASLRLHNFNLAASVGRGLEGIVATITRAFAADLLQVQQRLIHVSTQSCRRGRIGMGVAVARGSNSNGGRYDP